MPIRYNCMYFGKGSNRLSVVHLSKPNKAGFAGMISSKMFNDNVAIVVDRSDLSQRDYDFSCLAFSENGTVPRIVLQEDLFYDFKRGTDEARTILLHEVGHYNNGDRGNEHYDDIRREIAQAGSVLEMETKADYFAVEYLGCDTVLRGLKSLKKRVISLLIDEASADMYKPTLEEIDARIRLIEQRK